MTMAGTIDGDDLEVLRQRADDSLVVIIEGAARAMNQDDRGAAAVDHVMKTESLDLRKLTARRIGAHRACRHTQGQQSETAEDGESHEDEPHDESVSRGAMTAAEPVSSQV